MNEQVANERSKIVMERIANDFLYGDEAKAIRVIKVYQDALGTFWNRKQTEEKPRQEHKPTVEGKQWTY